MDRRHFIKLGAGGLSALVVGNKLPWIFEDQVYAAVQVHELDFEITDAIKQMVTHNDINNAECYFWLFKEKRYPAEVPGPNIFATRGDTIRITLTNKLDEPHAFCIPGVFDTGPIPPDNQPRTFTFKAPLPGTYLYYDNLNEPVNRVMGLHGAFIVMPIIPRRPLDGAITPYARSRPTRAVQRLFDDLGRTEHFPGLRWEEGDPSTDTPPFRQYVWLLHQASPNLFEEVGRSSPGSAIRMPVNFVNAFLKDPFIPTGKRETTASNRKAQYFTISGQSGHFVHNNPYLCPMNRVGEPVVVRVLNSGLWMHSLHMHANHVYVIAVDNVVQQNPIWCDVYDIQPLQTWDWLVPYIRPPDVPNERGIGYPDKPLISVTGRPVWPPYEEMGLSIPARVPDPNNGDVPVDPLLAVDLSPLCYPMHDHIEPATTSQGGNYNTGMISGINFTGDRTTPGGVTTFPHAPKVHGPDRTGMPAGPEDEE